MQRYNKIVNQANKTKKDILDDTNVYDLYDCELESIADIMSLSHLAQNGFQKISFTFTADAESPCK